MKRASQLILPRMKRIDRSEAAIQRRSSVTASQTPRSGSVLLDGGAAGITMTFHLRAIVAVVRRLVIRVSTLRDHYRAAPSTECPFIPLTERERGSSAATLTKKHGEPGDPQFSVRSLEPGVAGANELSGTTAVPTGVPMANW